MGPAFQVTVSCLLQMTLRDSVILTMNHLDDDCLLLRILKSRVSPDRAHEQAGTAVASLRPCCRLQAENALVQGVDHLACMPGNARAVRGLVSLQPRLLLMCGMLMGR